MKKNSKLLIFVAVIIILLSVFFILYSNNNDDLVKTNITTKENKTKKYEHIFPEKIIENDFYKGEFIANDIVSIYPRRDAIVKDIYFDIGDYVYEGQTLARLLNTGLEYEGSSNIDIARSELNLKVDSLEELKKIKQSKINEIDQKIIEKENILQKTIENFDNKINELISNDNSGSEFSVLTKKLNILNTNYSNALLTKSNIIDKQENIINQKYELLDNKISESLNKIIPIIYIGNNDYLSYNEINNSYIRNEFGAKNSSQKNKLISDLLYFKNNYNNLSIDDKYSNFYDLGNLFISVLKNTITSSYISDKDISNSISNLDNILTGLLELKQLIEDEEKQLSVILSTQNEKIESLLFEIEKLNDEISLIDSKNSTLISDKKLQVSKIESEIETLKKNKETIISAENKSIVDASNEIKVLESRFQNQVIKYGDYELKSPFSGYISKRNFSIGENITKNQEVFRLSGVNNSLSNITKKEVKFYVPQNISNSLDIGKNVYIKGLNSSFTGSIYRISPEVDYLTNSITVQAKVDDEINLPNNYSLEVRFDVDTNIYKVPNSVVYNKGDRTIVYYKKDNGKIGIRDIEIVSEDGEFILIKGNIDETLKIVITPIFIK